MPTSDPRFTATLERTAVWLNRADLALLRAMYMRSGGYSIHVRGAVAAMCDAIRAELHATPAGLKLLRSLNQENL